MNKYLILIIFAGSVFAGDPRAQFERLKSEGRAAMKAEDWVKAEAHYRQLLDLSDNAHQSAAEMYAEIVSPLAEIYKRTNEMEKLETLYQQRVERSAEGLERGLSQADLGFFYQSSDFASSDQFHGERLVEAAMKTFEQCMSLKSEGEQCRHRLADTAGIQGAIFFQKSEYERAEPFFRRVVSTPESAVQGEIMLVSLHALREILVVRKQFPEAEQLQLRATSFETEHPEAMARLKYEATKSRSR